MGLREKRKEDIAGGLRKKMKIWKYKRRGRKVGMKGGMEEMGETEFLPRMCEEALGSIP